ncbi:MAG: glutamine synthetase family protein [Sphaerobacter thermophilus]|uniref:Glutamine synthetase n=2 Tax=Sphaerobacter TaxID=2056 RepID=D1C7W1_SPHTD|nr:glutamine synthetase family protein [Sphaerobacter thermophilus]ACZ39832.1 glutamine synthetase, type I [Sphaerobacter thermophilus DSM 20745]
MVLEMVPTIRSAITPTAEEVLSRAEEAGVEFVNLQFTDVMGIVKSVSIPIDVFPDVIQNGQWFDGSSIAGFARIAESDMFLMPDLATFAVIPWEQGRNATARVICWVHNPNGDLFPGDPRAVLLRQLERLAQIGYRYHTGPELEFFLFRKDNGSVRPLPHDQGGYFDLTTDLAAEVRKDMIQALKAFGIKVEAGHHEVAIGQHEIDFEYSDALTTADHAVTMKYTLKAIAQQHGLHATFMPKPIEGVNGSGMHTHQSLAFLESGENAFVDTSDDYGLSKLARHFIAGQLAHARGMAAVLAPLVNSYRRLVPGFEAPVYVSWARQNRSALIRVPAIRAGRTAATRIELRCPDPAANPYLAYAVMLAAGLDGIERELPLPEPIEENLYHFTEDDLRRRNVATLPATLGEAMAELERDEVVREALGEHVVEKLLEAQKQEWDSFRRHVSTWELERYLEIY